MRDNSLRLASDTIRSDKTILTVASGSGIGGATVELKADRWPEELILRVRLHGLESLTISTGEVKLAASVLSHGDYQQLRPVLGTVARRLSQTRHPKNECPPTRASAR